MDKRLTKILLGSLAAALLGYGIRLYLPTFKYLQYHIGGSKVVLNNEIVIVLDDGWFPVFTDNGQKEDHVTFAKINPWFPAAKYLSVLDIIYKPDSVGLGRNTAARVDLKQFKWGQVALFTGPSGVSRLAFALDGRIRIYFDNVSDLDEIMTVSREVAYR